MPLTAEEISDPLVVERSVASTSLTEQQSEPPRLHVFADPRDHFRLRKDVEAMIAANLDRSQLGLQPTWIATNLAELSGGRSNATVILLPGPDHEHHFSVLMITELV